MLDALKSVFRRPRPSGPPKPIKRFSQGDPTIAGPPLERQDDGWHARLEEARTLTLFAFEPPPLESGMVTYRAELKSENLEGLAYLQMLVRFPGLGEFFSKGLTDTAFGTNDWSSFQVSFHLKEGQIPELLKLNIVAEGRGEIWVRSVKVEFTPFG